MRRLRCRPAPGHAFGLEAHEGTDIGLMLLPPAAPAQPGFEHRHANHPYLPTGPLVRPGGDESMTISWQAYEKAWEIRAIPRTWRPVSLRLRYGTAGGMFRPLFTGTRFAAV